jgi:hypothetical protein
MKKLFLIIISCLAVSCGSQSVPDWKNTGFNQLDNYKKNALIGKELIAESNFKKATDEIKRSGDLDTLAKAYMTKFGVHAALLEAFRDDEYLEIEDIAPNQEYMNFFNFLKGLFMYVDGGRLPARYRGTFKAMQENNIKDLESQINRIDDPLSRLIATGVAVKQKKYNETILKTAIDTASSNGWKKALIVYLQQLQAFYETQKDTSRADKIRKTIQVLKQ